MMPIVRNGNGMPERTFATTKEAVEWVRENFAFKKVNASNLLHAADGKPRTAFGFTWSFPPNDDPTWEKYRMFRNNEGSSGPKKHRRRPLVRHGGGLPDRTFENIGDALEWLRDFDNDQTIAPYVLSKALTRLVPTKQGFMWVYAKFWETHEVQQAIIDFDEKERLNANSVERAEARRRRHAEIVQSGRRKSMVVCLKDGVALRVFNSTVDAALWLRENGFEKAFAANIANACRGLLNNAYGFEWDYAEVVTNERKKAPTLLP